MVTAPGGDGRSLVDMGGRWVVVCPAGAGLLQHHEPGHRDGDQVGDRPDQRQPAEHEQARVEQQQTDDGESEQPHQLALTPEQANEGWRGPA